MPRVSRSEISLIVAKYINEGYKKVSKEETSRYFLQTLYHEELKKKVVLKHTSNGWLSIT